MSIQTKQIELMQFLIFYLIKYDKATKAHLQTLVCASGSVFDTANCHEIRQPLNEGIGFKQLERSPSDELLLTELTWDLKDFTPYEISAEVIVGEHPLSASFNSFKCFLNESQKECFIEITEEDQISRFTRTTLLKLLDIAEERGAKTVFVCIRKSAESLGQFMKTLLFIGFEMLEKEQMQKYSFTDTHILMKYELISAEEESDDD